jgi:hypothetical protein
MSNDIDPNYNGHLQEKYDSAQIDLSKEYLQIEIKTYVKDTNNFEQTEKYNFSSIWLTGNLEQNGVIGSNYQRII